MFGSRSGERRLRLDLPGDPRLLCSLIEIWRNDRLSAAQLRLDQKVVKIVCHFLFVLKTKRPSFIHLHTQKQAKL